MIAQAKALVMLLLECVLVTLDLLGLIALVRKKILEHGFSKRMFTCTISPGKSSVTSTCSSRGITSALA